MCYIVVGKELKYPLRTSDKQPGPSSFMEKVIQLGGTLWPFCFPSLISRCSSVFGVEPDLTREGGSIPVALTFQDATGCNVMLLPLGSSDDGAHSQNEKLNRYAFY